MSGPKDNIHQRTFFNYFFSMRAFWYWGTLVLATFTAIVVLFFTTESNILIVWTRYILGAIFVLWFPGYTFAKLVLPWEKLDSLERIGLSLALSLAIVAIEGLVLSYTVQGVEIISVTATLLILTLTFATAAIVREYRFK